MSERASETGEATTYTGPDIDGASTRMTLRNRGEPAGFSKVVAPLMAPAMRRASGPRRLQATLDAR